MKKMKWILPLLMMAILLAGCSVSYIKPPGTASVPPLALFSQESTVNGVTVKVTPQIYDGNSEWQFEVEMDTHEGSLDDDLMKVSWLSTEQGIQKSPLFWEGDPAGGHHRSGTLKFTGFSSFKKLTLAVKLVSGTHTFEWEP